MIPTTSCQYKTHYNVGMNLIELTFFLALIYTYCQSMVT